MKRSMTMEELRRRLSALSARQSAWLRAKQQWEHMSAVGVLLEWDVPSDTQLNDDGTWRDDVTTSAATTRGDGT